MAQTKMPWETLFPKQLKLYNTGIQADTEHVHPKCPPVIVVEGPRKSTKTSGVIHRFLRHVYETPGARAGIVAKRTKDATDGGVWDEILGSPVAAGAIEDWIESGLTEITTKDRDGNPGAITDSKTRTLYFRIRNYWGGESEVRLFPLQFDHQVKEVMRNLRYSCWWFSELSNFKDPNVFRASWMQLRMKHLKPWEHLWIADTNPDEEGTDCWIYKMFIEQRKELFEAMFAAPGTDDVTMSALDQYRKSIRHIQFFLEDNLSMDATDRAIQRANYMDDPGELSREFEGLWVKGHGNKGKHFSDLFSESTHVVGSGEEEIEISQSTQKLFTGWDIGAVSNHASGIMEKRLVNVAEQEISVWNIIASLSKIGEQIDIRDLGVEMLAMMRNLEVHYKRKFEWTHYADDSALTVWRPSANTYDYMIIKAATNDEIELDGVPKPAGSVETRVKLIRKLLRTNRLYVSAKCQDVIDMLNNLHKGPKADEYVAWDKHKHVFDWISYVLFMECYKELEEIASRKRPNAIQRNNSAITVPLG